MHPMQLTRDTTAFLYQIRRYDAQGVQVNEEIIRSSFIIQANTLIRDWPLSTISDLKIMHLEKMIALAPTLILIGTGKQLKFPERALTTFVLEKNIGIEIMDTPAACRTYMALAAEGRNVVAGLII